MLTVKHDLNLGRKADNFAERELKGSYFQDYISGFDKL